MRKSVRSAFTLLLSMGIVLIGLSVANAQRIDTNKAKVPQPQQAALQDNVVTRAEYVDAMSQEVACLQSRVSEADVQGPFWVADKSFMSYTYSVRGKEAHLAATKAEAQCSGMYRSQVERTWSQQTRPDDEEIDQLKNSLMACLDSAGVKTASAPSRSELASLSIEGNDAAGDCMSDHARLFIS